jgi:hypothetical protein
VDANALDDHQLVGVVLFLGALFASVVVPYASVRAVRRFKRRVYDEESAADRLMVFDLLIAGVTGQVVVVGAQVFDDVNAFRGEFLSVGDTWKHVIWADHVLRGRAALLLILILLPIFVAEWLRYVRVSNGTIPLQTMQRWTGTGLAVLSAALLGNVFMTWLLRILSW